MIKPSGSQRGREAARRRTFTAESLTAESLAAESFSAESLASHGFDAPRRGDSIDRILGT
ncbi:MAG: hypothetical protein ACF788_02930 [Novipirellula sp. JB048]